MPKPRPRLLAVAVALAVGVAALAIGCSDEADDNPLEDGGTTGLASAVDRRGTLPSGSTWALQAPEDWNGTLLLYSHGAVAPGSDNPARLAPDPLMAAALLERGYALVGSSYPDTGWVLPGAVEDQLRTLDRAIEELGEPERTLSWGGSMGGLIAEALLELDPDSFDGGVSMCGPLAGPDLAWDSLLDMTFVLQTLVEPAIEVVGITNPDVARATLRAAGTEAHGTPAGRARVALAAAIGFVPAWADLRSPPPTDLAEQYEAQALNLALLGRIATAERAELEQRIGGNPSTNVGVDYAELLGASPTRAEVAALYEVAGLDLDEDLARLAAAARIEADAAARQQLTTPVNPTGAVEDPLLTLYAAGDGLVPIQHQRAFADLVEQAGTGDLVRHARVERAGHCAFTMAEQVTAIDAVVDRITDGSWPATDAGALNERAGELTELAAVVDSAGQTGGTTPAVPAFDDTPVTPSPRLSPR